MTALIGGGAEANDPLQASPVGGKCVSNGPIPCGGSNGFSSPRCESCPQPPFSKEALDRRVEGTVLMICVIDKSGRATNVAVTRALPYELSGQAVRAVKGWTFQPANGPDGQPATVLQFIEMSFHLLPPR